MKKQTLSIIALLIGCFFILACGPEPATTPRQPPEQKAEAKQDTLKPQKKAAAKPEAPKIWPFSWEADVGGPFPLVSGADEMITPNYVVILDDSGSMDGSDNDGNLKMGTAKKALLEWIQTVPEGSNVAVVTFWHGIWKLRRLDAAGKADIREFMKKVHPKSTTPLADAFSASFKILTRQALRQQGYGYYTIVSITDGQADSKSQLSRWVELILKNTPITIYTIGFGIGNEHSLNQPGRTHYRAAENLAELRKALKEVIVESEKFDSTVFRKQ